MRGERQSCKERGSASRSGQILLHTENHKTNHQHKSLAHTNHTEGAPVLDNPTLGLVKREREREPRVGAPCLLREREPRVQAPCLSREREPRVGPLCHSQIRGV